MVWHIAWLWAIATWILAFPNAHASEIAILKSAPLTAYTQAIEGFRAELSGPGHTIQEYDLGGDLEQGRKIAHRLRASDTTLVLAVGLKAALAAKMELFDIPVLYCLVLDPDKYDLAAPNLIGLTLDVPAADQLAIMKSALPSLARVGLIYDPTKSGRAVDQAIRAAKQQRIQVVAHPIDGSTELPPALRTLLPTIDALWLLPDTTVLTDDSVTFILQEAIEATRPVFGFSPDFVMRGALMSLSVDYQGVGQQAARLTQRLLAGHLTPPARIPPDRWHLAWNQKTARYLDIEIPRAPQGYVEERY